MMLRGARASSAQGTIDYDAAIAGNNRSRCCERREQSTPMLRRGITEIRVRLTDSSVLQPTCGSFRRKVVVRKYQVTVEMLGARPQMCRRTPCQTFGLACSCGTAWRVDAPLLPIMNVRPASEASGPRATPA